jgi:hypothetical protein
MMLFSFPLARGRYFLEGTGSVASEAGRRRQPMCYTRKDRDLEREAREITESRLMEEEARHRQEQHDRRMAEREKPLTEKVKEMVGTR